MVECFNGRVQRGVLGITIHSHAKSATVLRGFNQAYNARRQRVLDGLMPEMILQQRLSARPALANPRSKPPKASAMENALHIIANAKEVSQLDTRTGVLNSLRVASLEIGD